MTGQESSVTKNKSNFFNDLQAKLTGSNPVALTTFPNLNSGNKYNDLANNSLKTLPNLKHQSLKRTYSIPNTFLKNRSKLPYRRDGDKLTENWVFIDFLHFWKMQGVDILANI